MADTDKKLTTNFGAPVPDNQNVMTAGPRGPFPVANGQVQSMTNRPTASSIDEYIAEFPAETRAVLQEVRTLISTSAPNATETISYAIPTFDMNGRHVVHFAGYDTHVGLYPAPSGLEAFDEELGGYKRGKGSVRFPLGEPLPTDLIRRIVEFRVAEVLRAAKK